MKGKFRIGWFWDPILAANYKNSGWVKIFRIGTEWRLCPYDDAKHYPTGLSGSLTRKRWAELEERFLCKHCPHDEDEHAKQHTYPETGRVDPPSCLYSDEPLYPGGRDEYCPCPGFELQDDVLE